MHRHGQHRPGRPGPAGKEVGEQAGRALAVRQVQSGLLLQCHMTVAANQQQQPALPAQPRQAGQHGGRGAARHNPGAAARQPGGGGPRVGQPLRVAEQEQRGQARGGLEAARGDL
jgi:hypothetical protein